MIWSKKCVRPLGVWGTANMSETTDVSGNNKEEKCTGFGTKKWQLNLLEWRLLVKLLAWYK